MTEGREQPLPALGCPPLPGPPTCWGPLNPISDAKRPHGQGPGSPPKGFSVEGGQWAPRGSAGEQSTHSGGRGARAPAGGRRGYHAPGGGCRGSPPVTLGWASLPLQGALQKSQQASRRSRTQRGRGWGRHLGEKSLGPGPASRVSAPARGVRVRRGAQRGARAGRAARDFIELGRGAEAAPKVPGAACDTSP